MQAEWQLVIDYLKAMHQKKLSGLYLEKAELELENQELKEKIKRKHQVIRYHCKRYNGLLKEKNYLLKDKQELIDGMKDIEEERDSILMELSEIRIDVALVQLGLNTLRRDFELKEKENKELKGRNEMLQQQLIDLKERKKCNS